MAAKSNGFDKYSYAELLDLQKRVEHALMERRATEARETKLKLEALAAESGFSVSELFGGKGKRIVAPKYRNPKDPSQTWAGRGRKPTWMVEAIAKGTKLESFLIK